MERGQTTLNKYVKALLYRDLGKCKRRLMDRRMKTVAFTEGKRLDEIEQARESGKRPYQRILLVIGSAAITFIVCLIMGLLLP